MKRLLFIHSVFIHSSTVLSDEVLSFQSLDFSEKRQMRNKQETISDGNETMQMTETERPDRMS